MSNPRAIKYRRLALAEPGKSAAAASPCRNRTRYPCYRRLAQTVAYTNRGARGNPPAVNRRLFLAACTPFWTQPAPLNESRSNWGNAAMAPSVRGRTSGLRVDYKVRHQRRSMRLSIWTHFICGRRGALSKCTSRASNRNKQCS